MTKELKDQLCHWTALLMQSELLESPEFKEFVQSKSNRLSEKDMSKYNAAKAMFEDFIEKYQNKMNNIVSIPKPIGKNKPVR